MLLPTIKLDGVDLIELEVDSWVIYDDGFYMPIDSEHARELLVQHLNKCYER